MSVKLPLISGERLIKIMFRRLFYQKTGRSHVILQKGDAIFSVPLHDELKKGTLKGNFKPIRLSVEYLLD
jgi:hypothetical protein